MGFNMDLSVLLDFAKQYGWDGTFAIVWLILVWYRVKPRGVTPKELFVRRWFWLLLTAWLLLVVGYHFYRYRYWGLPDKFQDNEVGFLVAEVPGDTNQEEQQKYANAIRDSAASTPDLQNAVRARMLSRSLPVDPDRQQAEAIRIGRWLRAAYVLRPFTVQEYQEPRITIIDQPDFTKTEVAMGKFPNDQLPDLGSEEQTDKLSVPQLAVFTLPRDLITFARCTLALSYYRRTDLKQASQELREVLASPQLPVGSPSRPYLEYLLGNTLLGQAKVSEAVEAYDLAVQLNPSSPQAHYSLGLALDLSRNFDRAEQEIRKALQVGPDSGE